MVTATYAELPPAYATHAKRVLADVEAGRRPVAPPPAKYATARTPSNPSLGVAAARASLALGEPLMPWQRHVVDTALELDPDRPGCWRYPLVVITVPRQSGKTTLMRAIRTARAIARPYQVILMTAQTGKDARKQWAKLVSRATRDTSPLAPFVTDRQSQGSEALVFPNGSTISPFAPTPKSVHGDTTHLWDVDEGWAFDAEQGAALIDALDPTQITVRDRQAYVFSTQGTAASSWWNDYVDAGRDSVTNPHARMAYFEWSAPEDADPYARETVASFHPAVGHTQQLDDLMEKAGGPAAVWHRAYLNLRSSGADNGAGIDLQLWAELGASGAQDLPAGRLITLAYAVAADRSGATIMAAWPTPAGTHLQLVASQAGAGWLPQALVELQTNLQPGRILADDAGHTRNATSEAIRLGVHVDRVRAGDYTEACTHLIGAVADGELTHDGAGQMLDALTVANLRPMAGSRGYDERTSAGPIDALKAGAVAAWGALDATPALQLF